MSWAASLFYAAGVLSTEIQLAQLRFDQTIERGGLADIVEGIK